MRALTRILTPTGMLGYGYPHEDFWACIEQGVDAIVVDSGSTDPGPYLLGLGSTISSEQAFVRDLTPMVQAAATKRIPLIISSAGGAGTREQVDLLVSLVEKIATEGQLHLKVAKIYADMAPEVVSSRLDQGRLAENIRGELPTAADIRDSIGLVAQMGSGPFTEVLNSNDPVDVIIAGRAYDPAPHAAWAMSQGVEPGYAWHAGKILECGGACAEPKGGGVIAALHNDGFEITPMSPDQRCTPLSVAAHTLYEKGRPDLLPGPDGVLDVTNCIYEAVDNRTVRVSGSQHRDAEALTLKVEGAAIAGQRAIFIGGVRDPILIGQIDEFLTGVRTRISALHPELTTGEAQLIFHVYGRNAVMGDLEPSRVAPVEIGILGEVTAATEELAKAIISIARIAVLHLPYPGQVATGGNLALPLNPMESSIGPVCRFTVYHVMEADGLTHLFPVTRVSVGV